MGRDRLYGLDALRGAAAIAVALYHLSQVYNFTPLPLSPAIAVDLFFILSGFVMTRSYECRLRNNLTTYGFLKLRYRRLIIPLAIGTTIGLLWVGALHGWSAPLLATFAMTLCFLPSVGAAAFPLNVPAWSLFIEIVANVLHGAFFAKMPTPRLLALALLSGLSFAMTAALGLSHWGPDILSILCLTPREVTCYLVGVWIFRRYGDAPLGNSPVLAIIAFAVALYFASIDPRLEMAALIACPFVVRASLALPVARSGVVAGALSYPLYATHVPVMHVARVFGLHPVIGLAAAVAVAGAVAIGFEMRRPVRRPAEAF